MVEVPDQSFVSNAPATVFSAIVGKEVTLIQYSSLLGLRMRSLPQSMVNQLTLKC